MDVKAGRARAAAARMDARLKEATPTVAMLVLAATAHQAAGDVDLAETLLQRAIDVAPDRLTAYATLGELYVRQHRLNDATEKFRQVLARNPKSTSTATMVGMLLEAQGQRADAEQQYRQVLAVDARAVVAANNLAWIYVASNRQLDEALQLARTAYQTLPDDWRVNDTMGWILYKKNLAASAVPYLEKANAGHPDDAMLQFHLGMAFMEAGEWTKARSSLQRAVSLKPDFEGAAEARRALSHIGGIL
jgi:tetratricopeptide (TPR) repeat protein